MLLNSSGFQSTAAMLHKSILLLPRRDRTRLAFVFFLQILTIFFDIAGVLILGTVVTIATSAIRGVDVSESVKFLDSFPVLKNSPQYAAAVLALLAATFLLLRSLLTLYFTYRNARFFAIREANLAVNFFESIFNRPLDVITRFSTTQYQFAANNSIHAILGGIIGQSISLVTELTLQIAMFTTLFIVSPSLTALVSFVFICLFLMLNKIQGKKARKWGHEISQATIEATSSISDGLASYREIIVSNKLNHLRNSFQSSRLRSAELNVKRSLLSNLSKYIFESTVILIGLIISGFAFSRLAAEQAASLVGLFLIAAMRIAPSLLRLQQGIIEIKGAMGASRMYFDISESITKNSIVNKQLSATQESSFGDHDGVVLREVFFKYNSNNKILMKNLSLNLANGKHHAIVGPSGAGKTTLVDLILGVLEQQSGEIKVFGQSPKYWHNQKNSGIAYVPQNVHIFDGSLLDNITFFEPEKYIDKRRIIEVLNSVGLSEWAKDNSEGLLLQLGERGSRISGGQRQRIALARALYKKPRLLVLDEATSSLDAENEFEITATIRKLPKSVTTITIAHRLSTVLDSDNVVYMSSGQVICTGSFDFVRNSVPNFDRQANLMGLKK